MYLRHGELLLRNAEAADSVVLAQWWNDGRVMAHAGFPNGLGTTPERVAGQLQEDSDEGGRRLIMEEAGKPIGEMCYRNKGKGTAEIGIKICDFSRQEKGLGKIFLRMLISELFSAGYDRIVLDTNLQNTRAQHVYEQLGFRRLRVNTDCWTDQLGRKQSSVDYEMRKGELRL